MGRSKAIRNTRRSCSFQPESVALAEIEADCTLSKHNVRDPQSVITHRPRVFEKRDSLVAARANRPDRAICDQSFFFVKGNFLEK